MDPNSGLSSGLFYIFPTIFIVFFVVVVAVMIGAVVFGVRASRRRRESIAAIVTVNGLSYVGEDHSLVDSFVGDPFGKGQNRRARDVVAGNHAGDPFQSFAYSYETETRDANGNTTKTTHSFQVTWIPVPAPFPHVRITPDSAWLRALGSLAGHDLNTESAQFNARWRVRANDERVAHAILTGPMIGRFMHADVRDRAAIFQGERLMSFAPQASDLTEPNTVVGMLQDVAALVPPFLIDDLRGRVAGQIAAA
ncbi:DUF3137 domain-containing protein [Demequina lutea]|uniref:DUF3137 domain-containing protein n=1 Tax=Demequina lutea TaxID=431489 RepID=A0A7Y9Z9Q7_9MICO|nr:DUF3137 domain-containing protein [Demequina lutea]NYI40105.1 hypothetical protein [Demequina lutea]